MNSSTDARKMGAGAEQIDKFNPVRKPNRGLSWPIFQLWVFFFILVTSGVGFGATIWLFKLPEVPNCDQVSWQFASASMRIYCAQLEAEKKTGDSLLRAIALVEALPLDHPLGPQINDHVEEWATDILNLAERKFQRGELDKAIAMAENIPIKAEVYQLVADRIERWRSIWASGVESYNEADKQLRAGNWLLAFRHSVKLSYVKNDYWATTKYQELIDTIQLAREESKKLDSAYKALRRGGLENLLQAIKIAEAIGKESYAYGNAQNIIADAQKKMVKLAERLIDRQNWWELLRFADKIPENLPLQEQLDDWKLLARAGTNAELGTVFGLETAIGQAKNISSTSTIYDTVQPLLNRWEREMADVGLLLEAQELARIGSIGSLTAAIAKAKTIPANNPRSGEAQRKINKWQREIAIKEDMPFLERGREFAASGTIEGLQAAISQASFIGPNRPLYTEAQNYIRQWRRSIQRQQDKPILDRAIALGNAGDFAAAIETAAQISRGRTFYSEAQGKIIEWEREIKARETLEKAYRIGRQGTVAALEEAIAIAYTIPSSTSFSTRRIQLLNRWSQQLLIKAQNEAQYSLQLAINIAQKIPYGTSAYNLAQTQIRTWREQLQPRLYLPEPEPVTEPGIGNRG